MVRYLGSLICLGKKCIDITTKDLLGMGILKNNIYPACPVYDLYCEMEQKGLILSDNDRFLLRILGDRISKIHPYLEKGTEKAKAAVYGTNSAFCIKHEAFIRDELPRTRWNEGREIALETKKVLNTTIKEMKTTNPALVVKNVEVDERKRFHSIWAKGWKLANDTANRFRALEISDKRQVF